MRMSLQENIMREAGFVSAAAAAEAVGVANVGSIHRMAKTGQLRGARAGRNWYVSVKSLLAAYADAAPILERIKALGVEPKDEPVVPSAPEKKGKARVRRAS